MSQEEPIILPDPDSNPTAEKKGPFGIEAVDPLVFVRSTDNPELRFAAKKIPTFNEKIEIREPAPVKPKRRSYTEWIPGFKHNYNSDDASPSKRSVGQFLQIAIGVVLFAIPVGILLLVIKVVISLYQ